MTDHFLTSTRIALAVCCLSWTVGGLTVDEQRCAAAEKPNFIIINIDDLGYGDIGPFGSKLNRTPHLDRMAKEGRKLTCFYAAPVCSPSRASLMTGCYPKRALSIPHVLFPGNNVGLAPSEVTVAELLKRQGYTTAIIGKWHLGDQPEFLPTRQGFDEYFGLPYSNDMGPAADGVKSNLGVPLPKPRPNRKGQPPLPLVRGETVLKRVLAEDQTQLVNRYTQEAVTFLWANRDRPFFLYLPHSAVHFPLYPGKAFQGQSKHGLFGDWVEEVDWSIGQVLQTLRELKLDQKTLVIFTSDNGGAPRHGAINTPLRGGKGSTFEGGMRVPTIAWWPDKIPAGTQTDAVTGMMDILPTLVKLAGGDLPTDRKLDGGDIWPVLVGTPGAKSPHESFYYFRGLRLQAVRNGDWKLHLNQNELYDLKNDIGEKSNVLRANPDVVKRLRGLAEKMKDDLGVNGKGPGCRPLGTVARAQPLLDYDGKPREGFQPPSPPLVGMGVMVGEVTPNSALVQVRLTETEQLVDGDLAGSPGVVEFVLQTESNGKPTKQTVQATAENDFIARASFTDLSPGVKYVCKTHIGASEEQFKKGPVAKFQTLPGPTLAKPVRFVVVTGMNYAKFHGDNRIDRRRHVIENNTELPAPYAGPDKHLGYPALATIRSLQPHFFIGTGDNVYYDTPKGPRAKTVDQLRRKWHEQFVQPRYHELFSVVPTYWEVDDHDYRVDDCDNTGDYDPSPQLGRRMLLEQLPIAPAGEADAKTYRTHRVSRDLQIWLPENRMYRSPNATPDGPEKTIWGASQKAWLKRTLRESDATFKLLISPNPMIGPDDLRKKDNHTNIGGFRHERDEFFAWLKQTGVADAGPKGEASKNFYLVCGDRHWQYHSIHPTGLQEFSCGALVDANSRLGRKPGDPKSTDPKGLIKQPYYQNPRSGGFLLIECAPADGQQPATLSFNFHDERGKVLYQFVKKS